MESPVNILKYAGLPKYDDKRGFEIGVDDLRGFSLSELENGRTVTIIDDKGRSATFVVGAMSSISVLDQSGARKEVPYLTISKLKGDGLNGLETIQTGLYVEGGGLDVDFFPPRESGKPSPAKRQGLRLIVNPWNIFPIAVTKLKVNEG